ncbi:uncharacterized protein BDW70DRAFT_131618 [Aspergillus foveolatus]|uniref:uncharacterized protein n=1 Tax=Aspergillus foveolatus TaxID=210207 RepID=UPI003CCDAB08
MLESWSWPFPRPPFSFWPFDLGILALGLTSLSTLKMFARKKSYNRPSRRSYCRQCDM